MLKLVGGDPTQIDTPLLAVLVCKDAELYSHSGLLEVIGRVRKLDEFQGAGGDHVVLHQPDGFKARRLMVVGLGELKALDRDTLRDAVGHVVGRAITGKMAGVAVAVPEATAASLAHVALLEAVFEGGCLANHRFDRYKQEKTPRPLKQISFVLPKKPTPKIRTLAKRVETVCSGTLLARDWVNTPSNDKAPRDFARTVVAMAKKANLKTTLLDKKELTRQKFGALLAVAAGSPRDPAMVLLDYAPSRAKQTVVLVGKGVMFDSGGLNLKTTKTINMMKVDMAGAAAVAATLLTVARLKPKVRVVGVMPLVENLISGRATRPGDIVRAHNGKTVEIGNTDAEGRLILADAMAFAVKKFKPDVVVDIATLTGACITALGDDIAGLFTHDDELAAALLGAAEKTRERCWRLPLPADYKELLKSKVADINNMPKSPSGAAISAALFLSEFVENTPWAHLDIAGPAYRKEAVRTCEAGGTGFGVRLFCDWLETAYT
jgi:leucyl aminopeptidase